MRDGVVPFLLRRNKGSPQPLGRVISGTGMTYRVRIYLQRAAMKAPANLGVVELQDRPVVGDQITFNHAGCIEAGRIDVIEPPDWERHRGTVPRVHVLQSI
jgi:hypothetical protein